MSNKGCWLERSDINHISRTQFDMDLTTRPLDTSEEEEEEQTEPEVYPLGFHYLWDDKDKISHKIGEGLARVRVSVVDRSMAPLHEVSELCGASKRSDADKKRRFLELLSHHGRHLSHNDAATPSTSSSHSHCHPPVHDSHAHSHGSQASAALAVAKAGCDCPSPLPSSFVEPLKVYDASKCVDGSVDTLEGVSIAFSVEKSERSGVDVDVLGKWLQDQWEHSLQDFYLHTYLATLSSLIHTDELEPNQRYLLHIGSEP